MLMFNGVDQHDHAASSATCDGPQRNHHAATATQRHSDALPADDGKMARKAGGKMAHVRGRGARLGSEVKSWKFPRLKP